MDGTPYIAALVMVLRTHSTSEAMVQGCCLALAGLLRGSELDHVHVVALEVLFNLIRARINMWHCELIVVLFVFVGRQAHWLRCSQHAALRGSRRHCRSCRGTAHPCCVCGCGTFSNVGCHNCWYDSVFLSVDKLDCVTRVV